MKKQNASDDRKYDEDRSKKVLDFLTEVDGLCRKHGLSIGHEDSHGGFEIYPIDDDTQEWLLDATDRTGAA